MYFRILSYLIIIPHFLSISRCVLSFTTWLNNFSIIVIIVIIVVLALLGCVMFVSLASSLPFPSSSVPHEIRYVNHLIMAGLVLRVVTLRWW